MPTAAYMPANRSATGTPTCPARAAQLSRRQHHRHRHSTAAAAAAAGGTASRGGRQIIGRRRRGRDLLRLAVGLAGDAHQAPHGLHHHVVPRAIPARRAASAGSGRRARAWCVLVWPSLAEAGDAAVDKTWVDGCEGWKVQPVAGHVSDLEVFHEYVAVLSQVLDHSLARWLGYIASD
jgi:hypothetical protein